jgi:hypothetical protein
MLTVNARTYHYCYHHHYPLSSPFNGYYDALYYLLEDASNHKKLFTSSAGRAIKNSARSQIEDAPPFKKSFTLSTTPMMYFCTSYKIK